MEEILRIFVTLTSEEQEEVINTLRNIKLAEKRALLADVIKERKK